MSINQINPELNDAFETYFPQMGVLWRFTFRVFTKMVQFGIKFRRTAFGGTQLVNERVVEYPLILKWLDPELGKVLDIGCWSSRLPIQLARNITFSIQTFIFTVPIYLNAFQSINLTL